jgi:hypothetical protein
VHSNCRQLRLMPLSLVLLHLQLEQLLQGCLQRRPPASASSQ